MIGLRPYRFAIVAGLVLVALQSGPARGDDPVRDPKGSSGEATAIAQTPEPPRKIKRLVYQPPRRGAPTRRVGGATRAPEDRIPVLVALAAEQGGTTSRDRPTLYWYLSAPSDVAMAFTIVDPREIDPLVKVHRPGPLQSGFWKFALASLDKRLEPGIEYEWYVALILDPARRSKDVVSSGTITLVRPSPTSAARINGSTGLEKAYVLADEGLWYDALEALTTEIMSHPADQDLRELRADLLEQVALPQVADSDREEPSPRLSRMMP